jgi:TolB-like protein/tetratricopeptide (TPR) repeat protein
LSFIEELKRRNVIKVAAAYLALGWVILQVSGTVVPALQLPAWTTTLLLWIGIAGLPFVLLFAWIYELTPEGLKRESEVDRSASITHVTGRRLEYIIIALLVLAIALFVFDRFGRGGEQEAVVVTAAPPADGAAPRPAQPQAPVRAGKSIAVLPFVNLSDDKDNEFFGDGLAEELLNLLAKSPDLRVAARTSSFHFKGKDPTIAEVAGALGVETVLEGSVRRSGDTIRVVVQLISAADGAHLWSEKYDRPLTDIFAVQDDIADNIVRALLPHLGAGGPKLAASDSGEISPALFERFMRARHRYYDLSPPAIAAAHREFLAITAAAPGYAPAWAWLARSWMGSCVCAGGDVEEAVAYPQAQQAIDTALKLDANSALALMAQGLLWRRQDRMQEAEAVFDRAIAADPLLVDAYIGRERLLAMTGRPDEAISGLEKAHAIDPLHPEVLYDLAHLLNLQNRKREAFAAVEQLYGINPTRARELEMHLYSDSKEVARELYLSEAVFREGSKELPPDQLAWAYLIYGLYDHPVVMASQFAALSLALRGQGEDARARLAELDKAAGTDAEDARRFARIALGERDAVREELWAKWQALESKKFGARFDLVNGLILIALLQDDAHAGDAAGPIAALAELVAKLSPLHQADTLWFQARLHLARGEREAAIATYSQLAATGSPGMRMLGGYDLLLDAFADEPRMQPVREKFDANLAAQLAELERLRGAGVDVVAARREYVAKLP